MNKTLVIINGTYPYQRSEDYLANEVNYIQGFNKIIIFPMFIYGHKKKSDIKDYPVPKNIHFFNSQQSYHKNILFCIYFILCHTFFYDEFWNILKQREHLYQRIKKFIRTSFKSINAYRDIKRELIKNCKNEKIYLYSYWMADTAVTLSLLKKYSKLPIIFTFTRCHRFDVYEYANPTKYISYRKLILSTVDKIYAISNDAKFHLEKSYPQLCKNKIQIQRLGTDEHGVIEVKKTNILRIVSCSWLRPVKRIPIIFEALDSLNIPIEWTHYGDGEEMGILQSKIKKNKNKKLKIKLAGKISNSQLLEIYKNIPFDIFINVSENEGVPVSIMEAMSFGMIIIATAVGGTSEIVHNGKNGYLLPQNCSKEQIAEKIFTIYNIPETIYDEMRKNSRLLWNNLSCAKENYKTLYRELQKR